MTGNGRVSLASRIEGGPVQRLRRAQFFSGQAVSNKLASCSIIAPPSCSASMIVTALL